MPVQCGWDAKVPGIVVLLGIEASGCAELIPH